MHSTRIQRVAVVSVVLLLQLVLPVRVADAALTLSLVTSPAMGIVFSGATGRQFILNTNDTITGTASADHVSGAAAGQFTITDDIGPSSLVILVDNISTAGGLSVADATCSYNGGAQQSCDGAGLTVTSVASGTLKVGLDVSTTQAHSGGDTAMVMLDVSVSYL